MFDYLQKFNSLSPELREKVSTQAVMSAMEELEQKYGVDLAVTVMKVMVKDVDVNNLDKYFSQEFKLDSEKSDKLSQEMKDKVFAGVSNYLGIIKNKPTESISSNITPSKPVSSSFFFDIEDEEEVRGLASGDMLEKKEIIGVELENRVNEIVVEADINFGSEELLERFKKILTTYIKGVRDRMETKQTLIKPFDSGGMGFDNDSADKIIKIAEIKKNQKTSHPVVLPPKKIIVPEDNEIKDATRLRNAGVRDVEYDFSALASREKKSPDSQEIDSLDTDHELAPPAPSLSTIVEPEKETSIVIEKEEKITTEVVLPQKDVVVEPRNVLKELGIENSPSITMNKRVSPEAKGKIKMDDVKVVPKILSPIDELRQMSLISFRRLASEPASAAQKIKEKIKLLEGDGYGKRLEGIKAWRESPVYKSYLEIGSGSMGSNQPIDAIIENIKTEGRDSLNNQEFEAVMNLNKDLRF